LGQKKRTAYNPAARQGSQDFSALSAAELVDPIYQVVKGGKNRSRSAIRSSGFCAPQGMYMPIINALQHLFSSVERGYDPRRKRGFQTVAAAEELVGTEDLQVLEDAAFYAVSTERRAAKDFPVKETFFRLPSGRFAVGRTVNWGTDSLGREGNYLTHHLVCQRDDLLAAGANPFAVLDAARLAEADSDLTPRALPPLALKVAAVPTDLRTLADGNAELLANLAAAVDGGVKTALLIGAEARSRQALRGLFAALATEERLRLTFSTHFYEAHHLRPLFALVTVKSRAEAPSQREAYHVFDLDGGEFPQLSPASAYAEWLAECLRSGRWEEVSLLNGALDELRGGRDERDKISLPVGARACAALWERAGKNVVRALVGEGQLIVEFVRHSPSPRPLADALLEAASPSELCGAEAATEEAQACLSTLRSAATGKVWRAWVKRWERDSALAPLAHDAPPWWKRWGR
jgi:hypothetical protein